MKALPIIVIDVSSGTTLVVNWLTPCITLCPKVQLIVIQEAKIFLKQLLCFRQDNLQVT